MSSILDALNKLEDGRGARPGQSARAVDPRVAARELVMQERPPSELTIRVSRRHLVAAGGLMGLLIVGTAAVVMFLAGAGDRATPVSENAGAAESSVAASFGAKVSTPATSEGSVPVPDPVEREPMSVTTPPEPFDGSEESAAASSIRPSATLVDPPAAESATPENVAARPAAPPTRTVRNEPLEPPVAVSIPEEPAGLSVRESGWPDEATDGLIGSAPKRPWERHSRLESESGSTTSGTATPASIEHLSLRQYPEWTAAVEARHKLPRIMLNMAYVPKPGSPRPVKSALINRDKVFIGGRIQGSNAVLFAVETYGVGIEIAGTGERYFLPL